jgi:NitT/TauT family transport system permease protein
VNLNLKGKLSKFLPLISILLFLAFWELLPRVGFYPEFLPPFSVTVVTLTRLLASGVLWPHIFISLERVAFAFIIAVFVAVPLGLAMGWYQRFEKYVDPLLQSLRQTSATTLLPVFIIFFGVGELSKMVILLWVALWPILLNVISGVKSVDPVLIKSAKSMGASDRVLFRKVILPSSTPLMMTGIRLAASLTLLMLVAAEMLGANSGLGFFIMTSQYNFKIPEMYAGILLTAILGLIFNYGLVFVERTLVPWKRSQ